MDEKDETKNDENAATVDEKASKKEADTLEPAKAKDESDRPVKKRKLAEEPANPIVKKKKKSTPMKSEPGLGKTEPEKLVEIDTTKPVGEANQSFSQVLLFSIDQHGPLFNSFAC